MRPALRVCVLALAFIAAIGTTPAFAALFTSQPASQAAVYASGTLAAPTSLRCTSIVSNGVDLAWNAPSVTTPAQLRYTVLRRPNGSGSFTTVASNLSAATYHDNPGLLASFNYVVSAKYFNWTSSNSTQITATFAAVLSLCS